MSVSAEQVSLSIVRELERGVTPENPVMDVIRFSSETIGFDSASDASDNLASHGPFRQPIVNLGVEVAGEIRGPLATERWFLMALEGVLNNQFGDFPFGGTTAEDVGVPGNRIQYFTIQKRYPDVAAPGGYKTQIYRGVSFLSLALQVAPDEEVTYAFTVQGGDVEISENEIPGATYRDPVGIATFQSDVHQRIDIGKLTQNIRCYTSFNLEITNNNRFVDCIGERARMATQLGNVDADVTGDVIYKDHEILDYLREGKNAGDGLFTFSNGKEYLTFEFFDLVIDQASLFAEGNDTDLDISFALRPTPVDLGGSALGTRWNTGLFVILDDRDSGYRNNIFNFDMQAPSGTQSRGAGINYIYNGTGQFVAWPDATKIATIGTAGQTPLSLVAGQQVAKFYKEWAEGDVVGQGDILWHQNPSGDVRILQHQSDGSTTLVDPQTFVHAEHINGQALDSNQKSFVSLDKYQPEYGIYMEQGIEQLVDYPADFMQWDLRHSPEYFQIEAAGPGPIQGYDKFRLTQQSPANNIFLYTVITGVQAGDTLCGGFLCRHVNAQTDNSSMQFLISDTVDTTRVNVYRNRVEVSRENTGVEFRYRWIGDGWVYVNFGLVSSVGGNFNVNIYPSYLFSEPDLITEIAYFGVAKTTRAFQPILEKATRPADYQLDLGSSYELIEGPKVDEEGQTLVLFDGVPTSDVATTFKEGYPHVDTNAIGALFRATEDAEWASGLDGYTLPLTKQQLAISDQHRLSDTSRRIEGAYPGDTTAYRDFGSWSGRYDVEFERAYIRYYQHTQDIGAQIIRALAWWNKADVFDFEQHFGPAAHKGLDLVKIDPVPQILDLKTESNSWITIVQFRTSVKCTAIVQLSNEQTKSSGGQSVASLPSGLGPRISDPVADVSPEPAADENWDDLIDSPDWDTWPVSGLTSNMSVVDGAYWVNGPTPRGPRDPFLYKGIVVEDCEVEIELLRNLNQTTQAQHIVALRLKDEDNYISVHWHGSGVRVGQVLNGGSNTQISLPSGDTTSGDQLLCRVIGSTFYLFVNGEAKGTMDLNSALLGAGRVGMVGRATTSSARDQFRDWRFREHAKITMPAPGEEMWTPTVAGRANLTLTFSVDPVAAELEAREVGGTWYRSSQPGEPTQTITIPDLSATGTETYTIEVRTLSSDYFDDNPTADYDAPDYSELGEARVNHRVEFYGLQDGVSRTVTVFATDPNTGYTAKAVKGSKTDRATSKRFYLNTGAPQAAGTAQRNPSTVYMLDSKTGTFYAEADSTRTLFDSNVDDTGTWVEGGLFYRTYRQIKESDTATQGMKRWRQNPSGACHLVQMTAKFGDMGPPEDWQHSETIGGEASDTSGNVWTTIGRYNPFYGIHLCPDQIQLIDSPVDGTQWFYQTENRHVGTTESCIDGQVGNRIRGTGNYQAIYDNLPIVAGHYVAVAILRRADYRNVGVQLFNETSITRITYDWEKHSYDINTGTERDVLLVWRLSPDVVYIALGGNCPTTTSSVRAVIYPEANWGEDPDTDHSECDYLGVFQGADGWCWPVLSRSTRPGETDGQLQFSGFRTYNAKTIWNNIDMGQEGTVIMTVSLNYDWDHYNPNDYLTVLSRTSREQSYAQASMLEKDDANEWNFTYQNDALASPKVENAFSSSPMFAQTLVSSWERVNPLAPTDRAGQVTDDVTGEVVKEVEKTSDPNTWHHDDQVSEIVVAYNNSHSTMIVRNLMWFPSYLENDLPGWVAGVTDIGP